MVSNLIANLVTEFMQEEYDIRPSQTSLDILVESKFSIRGTLQSQYRNLDRVQRKINGNTTDPDILVAKIFSLAFPYNTVQTLDDLTLSNWSGWLGSAEYRLGSIQKRDNKKIAIQLFNKSLEHLLIARQQGNQTRLNASLIGSNYLQLERYAYALPYLGEARQKGDESRESASKIGSCYFQMRRYVDALSYLEEARQKGDQSNQNASLTGTSYFMIGRYEEASHYLKISRIKGNNTKELASMIGRSNFRLEKYEEGLEEYELALDLSKNGEFNNEWMGIFDNILEGSFNHIVEIKERFQTQKYIQLLQRFQKLYNNFIEHWQQNIPTQTIYFTLMFDRFFNPTDIIGAALEEII